jgi:transcriptional antiterminator NusG
MDAKERKFFPGYVLVKCDLTDEPYHLIKNTPKVTGFLGADKKPMPIPDIEAERIKGKVADGVERPKAEIRFEIGENVRVADGKSTNPDRVSKSLCRSSAAPPLST